MTFVQFPEKDYCSRLICENKSCEDRKLYKIDNLLNDDLSFNGLKKLIKILVLKPSAKNFQNKRLDNYLFKYRTMNFSKFTMRRIYELSLPRKNQRT